MDVLKFKRYSSDDEKVMTYQTDAILLDDIVRDFADFLRSVGYMFDKLEVVNNEEKHDEIEWDSLFEDEDEEENEELSEWDIDNLPPLYYVVYTRNCMPKIRAYTEPRFRDNFIAKFNKQYKHDSEGCWIDYIVDGSLISVETKINFRR